MCTEELITEVSKSVIEPLSGKKISFLVWQGWSKNELEEIAKKEAAINAAAIMVMEYAKQVCKAPIDFDGILQFNIECELEHLMEKMPIEQATEQCKKNYNDGWWLG
ncbi:MAG TPA: hypothetical protein VFE71_10350 [Bacteroidales bacterium]|nr:hypothetical protein [Bacteroidales bacterium]